MASLGSKREWEVSDIEEGKGVCVHGIPVSVSPAKESRATKGVYYFEARLSDGKKSARVVSFDTSHRDDFKRAEEKKEVVALSNSIVKKSRFTSEMEVHMNKRSKVIDSPRKMSLCDAVDQPTKAVKIADLVTLAVGQEIDVKCKVVEIGDVEMVKKAGDGNELRKRDVTVGDETGSCRLVFWEGDVDSVEEGKTYQLVDVGVRRYGVTKYLSYTAKSLREEIADMQDVNEDNVVGEKIEDSGRIVNGEISAVVSTSEYLSCKLCRSKAESEDGVLAECTKCSAVMKVRYCEESKSAKFIVLDGNGRETTLSAFEPILSRIVNGVSGRNLSVKLLMAPPKLFRFNDRNVVFSIQDI